MAMTNGSLYSRASFVRTNKPYVRWWWFNQPISARDVDAQLEWAARQGFGGVEIAWVYPLPDRPPGPRWLSGPWISLVVGARQTCGRMGLGCDFTFGSLWPFGDSQLRGDQVSQWHTGPSPQRIDRHWESVDVPGGPPVLNHLDRHAFETYARRMSSALAPALQGEPSCLFCDSWEVEEEGKLWTGGMETRFRERFGYSIEPFMASLDQHPGERYDYRLLVSDLALQEFYEPYCSLCRGLGTLSRVQCHGAPTDILAAYALADVPESEALLFDAGFSRVAASAAAISGREAVSCESFTCLYGWNPWPREGPHLGEEKVGDLRLLADALAANGVNRFVWHGMPFQTADGGRRFYASVHVGPDGALAPRMPELNLYLEELSRFLREGRPAHRIAWLLPLEDVRMQGELPPELRKPSARYWWELQHPLLPRSLLPWSPLCVSGAFLDQAECLPDGGLRVGEVSVGALVVDCAYVDRRVLEPLARLAGEGARVVLARRPMQPGRATYDRYADLVESFTQGARTRFAADPPSALGEVPPFLTGEDLPDFFVRQVGDDFAVFAAHPAARAIRYPMAYGASDSAPAETRRVRFLGPTGAETDLTLHFPPGGGTGFRVGSRGAAGEVPLAFDPGPR